MDSMPDFDTKGPGFDSRSLHILFNSFFLLCQVLSEANFTCISTSNFPCECTKNYISFFKMLLCPLRPAFGNPNCLEVNMLFLSNYFSICFILSISWVFEKGAGLAIGP